MSKEDKAPHPQSAAGKSAGQHGGKPSGKPMGKPKSGGSKHKGDDGPVGPLPPARIKALFREKVDAAVGEKFGLKNPMQRPRLKTITINVNMGRHLEGTKLPPLVRQTVLDTLTAISGQKPIVIKAKKSVSNFKVRASRPQRRVARIGSSARARSSGPQIRSARIASRCADSGSSARKSGKAKSTRLIARRA